MLGGKKKWKTGIYSQKTSSIFSLEYKEQNLIINVHKIMVMGVIFFQTEIHWPFFF